MDVSLVEGKNSISDMASGDGEEQMEKKHLLGGTGVDYEAELDKFDLSQAARLPSKTTWRWHCDCSRIG